MKKLLGLLAVAPMALAACGGDDAVKLSAGEQAFVDNISTKFEVQQIEAGADSTTAEDREITQKLIDDALKFYTVSDNKDVLGIAEFKMDLPTAAGGDDSTVFVSLLEYNNEYKDDSFKSEKLIFMFTDTGTILDSAFTGNDWTSDETEANYFHTEADALIKSWTNAETVDGLDWNNITGATENSRTITAVNKLAEALEDSFAEVKPAAVDAG